MLASWLRPPRMPTCFDFAQLRVQAFFYAWALFVLDRYSDMDLCDSSGPPVLPLSDDVIMISDTETDPHAPQSLLPGIL